MAKVHARCPVCNEVLVWDQPESYEMFGVIPINDTGCMEVTRLWTPEVENHLSEHRQDGSMMKSWITHRLEQFDRTVKWLIERGSNG